MKIFAAISSVLFLVSSMMSAYASDNQDVWTEEQLKTICHYRAEKNTNSARHYDRCIQRNEKKIGRAKKPGEASELNKAEAILTKKAATQ